MTYYLILFFHLQILLVLASIPSNETDKLALLSLKDKITRDPLNLMSSWNTSLSHCNWPGVTCSARHPGRVTLLNLGGSHLSGSLPPQIGNLSFLKGIRLRNNSFRGEIPEEIGRLFRLQILDLSNNEFEGEIPRNLSGCLNLEGVSFNYNRLTGIIPVELSSLATKLTDFLASQNSLAGEIPRWFGNASGLVQLSLARNYLRGVIPSEIGKLSNLRLLQLSSNNLTGTLPSSIYNLSSLVTLAVGKNQLTGQLPANIGFTLPNLEGLNLGNNSFTGPIPESLANATELKQITFAYNGFSGKLPLNFGSLKNLSAIAFSNNQFESLEFLTSLVNCTNLMAIDLGSNKLKGELPDSIANLSTTLQYLALEDNQISGTIPNGIVNLAGLTWLGLDQNFITGEIPSSIGRLKRLVVLGLSQNRISGFVPSSLGNITDLDRLYLNENLLEGSIPASLGSCKRLTQAYLFKNNLSGAIPVEIVLPPAIIIFDLSMNRLTGPLPSEIGDLTQLQEFYVSGNRLSGEIPGTLSRCSMLEVLHMENNLFEGSVPSDFASLKSLKVLDLSRNNLSGPIPMFLQNFTLLRSLNLSFNDLHGGVPREGIFRNITAFSVAGNRELCGGIDSLQLPACKINKFKKKKAHLDLIIAIPVAVSLLIFTTFFAFVKYQRKKSRRKVSTFTAITENFPKISYSELHRATDGFSSSNLIGEGSYGSVYKGTIGEETVVAMKVFNLKRKGASKSFMAECKTLRNIRHRNLLKIITACSSIDHNGGDFKALVSELMPNGSLENWLHDLELGRLSVAQRLSIAMDVGCAIEYLHYDCEVSVVHGDLKPSNILISHDLNAVVGDFGLARFLSDGLTDDSFANQTNSSWVKGTVGYVAPEYGIGGNASVEGDVYSFGILLLEMFTGRRPTDGMFEGGQTLHSFTKTALSEGVIHQIVEPSLLSEIENFRSNSPERENMEHGLSELLKIGVSCSMESPTGRMEMKDVVAEMATIKNKYFSTRNNNGGRREG